MKNDPTFDMPSQIASAVNLTAYALAGVDCMAEEADKPALRQLAAEKTKH